jgi:DNA primase
VASLGTALTEDQLKLLKQFTNKLYMAYDGDEAGLKAAMRGSIISLGQNYKPYIIDLPAGEDPDSFLLKYGQERFDDLIDKALPFIDFYASSSKIKLDKKTRIDDLLKVLETIPDEIAKDLLVKEISEGFKVQEASIRSNLRSTKRRVSSDSHKVKANTSINRYEEEKYALLLAIHENLIEHLIEEVDSSFFFVDKYKNIFSFLESNYTDVIAIADPSVLLNLTDDSDVINDLSELIYEEPPRAVIDKFILEMKLRKLRKDLEIVSSQILQSPEDSELYTKKKYLRTQIRLLGAQVVGKTLH